MQTGIGEVLVSVSDDMSIRIYDPSKDFQILYSQGIEFPEEWQTLTYVALEKVE